MLLGRSQLPMIASFGLVARSCVYMSILLVLSFMSQNFSCSLSSIASQLRSVPKVPCCSMPHELYNFGVCAGLQGSCPWKQSLGLDVDRTDARCPLCDGEALARALEVRHGQEITMALVRIKSRDAAAYQLALARLEQLKNPDIKNTFKSRVARTELRRHQAVLRRPAAADDREPDRERSPAR